MRSAVVRRKAHDATAWRAASFSRSGPSTFCTVEIPAASTAKATCTSPPAPAIRATGGTTGRRPFTRSGTPAPSETSRTAEKPGCGGGVGGGASAGPLITSTGGGAGDAGGAGAGSTVVVIVVGTSGIGSGVGAGAGVAAGAGLASTAGAGDTVGSGSGAGDGSAATSRR